MSNIFDQGGGKPPQIKPDVGDYSANYYTNNIVG